MIDDEVDVLEVLAESVAAPGHHVHAVPTAAAALHHAREARPDVVLLDLVLPVLSGPVLLQRLRELHSGLPIVVLTAQLDPELEAQMRALGASAVIHKPVELEELGRVIAAALGPSDDADAHP